MPDEQERTPPERRRRDAAATQEALLKAARTLMNERGIHGTSTRDVAQAAGVNQGLVYRYFGSKEKLFALAAAGPDEDDGSVFATAPLSEVPHLLLDTVLERIDASGQQTHPMSGLLSGAQNEAIRAVVRERIEKRYGEQLAPRLSGPDAHLRAELLAALVVGIGLLRGKIGSTALVNADRAELHRYVDTLAAVLLGEEQA
jgi:AcrR family transcriptional regulator